MAASSQAPELGIYASQRDQKCCFLILPILHYRNSTTMSNPVGFSWVTHLNTRSGEHAQLCKTVLHADVSAQGMLFISYILPFPFQVDNVPSPLGGYGSLAKCSSGDMPHPHQPHVGLMGDWAQPAAHFGLAGFRPTMVSLPPLSPGTASSVNVMQRGCFSLSISFITMLWKGCQSLGKKVLASMPRLGPSQEEVEVNQWR